MCVPKNLSINRLMKYENVYGPFNLQNCSSIIHLSDIQLYQQEFIPELPLFYDAFIIFVLLDTVYIFISWGAHTLDNSLHFAEHSRITAHVATSAWKGDLRSGGSQGWAQPSSLAAGAPAAPPVYHPLLSVHYSARDQHKNTHLVCTAQVTETCIFLLNTRLMTNN